MVPSSQFCDGEKGERKHLFSRPFFMLEKLFIMLLEIVPQKGRKFDIEMTSSPLRV